MYTTTLLLNGFIVESYILYCSVDKKYSIFCDSVRIVLLFCSRGSEMRG